MTTSPGRAHAIGETGFDSMLGQFRELAQEFLEAALAGRHHGFSNVRDTVEELHKGASKALPCGAGARPDGGGDQRRRGALPPGFAGSEDHKLGTGAGGGRRHGRRRRFSTRITSTARPTAGPAGRVRSAPAAATDEAYTRYGTTQAPNLHYCEWIRGWTETCLEIYGEIAERNPAFSATVRERRRAGRGER